MSFAVFLAITFIGTTVALLVRRWERVALAVGVTGPHRRHLIEHYEALLRPAHSGVVDYDTRPRDRELERVRVAVVAVQQHDPREADVGQREADVAHQVHERVHAQVDEAVGAAVVVGA